MASSVAEWAGVALAGVAGTCLVLLVVAAAGVWWLRRKARRRLEALARIMAGRAGRAAVGAVHGRWQRLPRRVPYHGWQPGGPPQVR